MDKATGFLMRSKGLGMRIAIATLGCKVNQSESALIEGELRARGYEVVDYKEDPDLCIVNTCTVTAASDRQSRQLIRRAVRHGARVIATGCYAQLRAHELSEIKGVIYVTGNSGKGCLVDKLKDIFAFDKPVSSIDAPDAPVTTGTYYSKRSRAFLKIQDGCDRSCSYCTVPMARGKSRSLNLADALRISGELYSKGYKEIVLTGVHIGTYGHDLNPPSSLAILVRKVKQAYPDIRIRLSSIEPQECNGDIISLLEEGLICPHLHIPLQSGSDRILSLMNRGYNSAFYRDIINSIVSINPDISIGTDVIVGFPKEGEGEFYETVNLIKGLPFSYIHVFPYSERLHTPAAALSGHIDPKEKKKRMDVLKEIAQKKKKDYFSRHLGRVLEVIVEGEGKTDGFLRAISENYIRVCLKKDGIKSRSMLLVKAISMFNDDLICEPIKYTNT